MPASVPPRILTDRDPGEETAPPILEWSVLVWRFDRLVDAGYPVDVSAELAGRGDVDLHQAVELVERGATVGEALRILT